MKNSKLFGWGLVHSLGVGVYVSLVALLMQNGERIFGQMNNLLGPVAILMLFVLSAAVTGALVLGRPVLFYLDGHKAEAVKLFGFTLGWLFVLLTVIILFSRIWLV
ncbi:MAG: hypothetical protein WC268_05160 [Patescibacteria group bacterium]|jgi:hypothetical protein